MDTGYRSVAIPSELYERVKRVVLGGSYVSVSDFVKEAIRLRLEEADAREVRQR